MGHSERKASIEESEIPLIAAADRRLSETLVVSRNFGTAY